MIRAHRRSTFLRRSENRGLVSHPQHPGLAELRARVFSLAPSCFYSILDLGVSLLAIGFTGGASEVFMVEKIINSTLYFRTVISRKTRRF